ncbi:RNA polymerase sigma factor [Streptomyces mirabilis]|uniref:RNA polymerase sigma factor n=1 Tax=Streptomyces mirabilis TaxID=68239 RepID=UPI003668DA69
MPGDGRGSSPAGEQQPPATCGFEAFFRRYDSSLRRYLYARGARGDVLEDAAQEAMLQALQYWKCLQDHPRPAAWLFTVGQAALPRRTE